MSLITPQLDMSLWQGRDDRAEGDAGRRWHQVIRPLADHQRATDQANIALLGFQSDEGVKRNLGRPGAAQGPQAIRAALANLPLRACQQLADAGDIVCPPAATAPDNLEQAQSAYAAHLSDILQAGYFPIALGGGHEIAYASFNGLAQYLSRQNSAEPTRRIGIINFDAHFDLRQAERPSSGTPFRQIAEDCSVYDWPFHYCCLGVSEYANTLALFQRAEQLKVQWQRDDEMIWPNLEFIWSALQRFIDQVDHLYLTLCLDVLPGAIAPGVSAPAARGVDLGIIELLINRIIQTRKLRLADIAEMNPQYDIDQRTARTAARLVGRIANGIAGLEALS